MRIHYCGCDIYLGSVIESTSGDGAHTVSDDTKEESEAIFVPSSSSHRDPNRAPTEVAPSTPVPLEEAAPHLYRNLRLALLLGLRPRMASLKHHRSCRGLSKVILNKLGLKHAPSITWIMVYVIQIAIIANEHFDLSTTIRSRVVTCRRLLLTSQDHTLTV